MTDSRRLATLEKLADCCTRRWSILDPPETEKDQIDALANDLEITCLLGELGIVRTEFHEPLIWVTKTEYERLKALDNAQANPA